MVWVKYTQIDFGLGTNREMGNVSLLRQPLQLNLDHYIGLAFFRFSGGCQLQSTDHYQLSDPNLCLVPLTILYCDDLFSLWICHTCSLR